MCERCRWAVSHPLLLAYHDQEWGVPTHERTRLYEFLVLEGAQAGLSWLTVLKRRDAYREAFSGFDPDRVAEWTEADVVRLLQCPGLIRNRSKITSSVANARAFRMVEQEFGGFDAYLDRMVGGAPIIHHYREDDQVPPFDALSQALSHDLGRRGFRFVGPTICYSYLQAVGVVMDHVTSCFRYQELL